MDEKKFINLFKNLQNVMCCPSCGSLYEVSDTNFVGSQDGYFLLSMNCSKCSLPVWVNVFAGTTRDDRLITSDLTISDYKLLELDPITPDSVIAFSEFIRTFKGNFDKLTKR